MNYPIGSIFKKYGEIYILSRCSASTFALICLEDGNRWDDFVKIDIHDRIYLTEEELMLVTGKNEPNWNNDFKFLANSYNEYLKGRGS